MSRIALALSFALACALSACAKKAPPPQEPTSTPPPAEATPAPAPTTGGGPYVYPEEVTQAFMSSCMESGGNEPVCTCVLQKLQAQYSVDDLAGDRVTEQAVTTMTEECLGVKGTE